MWQSLRTATSLLLTLTILTGGIYPLMVTATAKALFRHQAEGSLVRLGDQIVGSALIGQSFQNADHFWGRLSATGPLPYNAAASSGSNYGPLHPARQQSAKARLAALNVTGSTKTQIPVDLVTASASGLDPHISTAAAELQVPRVAFSRRMTEDAVRQLVRQHTEGRQFGVLGEPRVNVLQLNLALDQFQNRP